MSKIPIADKSNLPPMPNPWAAAAAAAAADAAPRGVPYNTLRPTPVAVWSELALEYRSTLARQPAVLLRDDEMLDEGLLGAKLQEMARLLGEPAPRSLALPPSLPGVRRGLRPWTPQTYANEGAKLRQIYTGHTAHGAISVTSPRRLPAIDADGGDGLWAHQQGTLVSASTPRNRQNRWGANHAKQVLVF